MADASRSNKNKSILPHVSTIILFSLIGIGMIVAYFVFLQMSTGAVEDSLKVVLSLFPDKILILTLADLQYQ
jgi:hypothetical protein